MLKKDLPYSIQKEEPFRKATDKEVEEIKNLLKNKDKNFNSSYILKQLNTKDSLRKIFLSVLKNNPTKISEVYEDTLMHKQNCYPLLSQLVNLNLLRRIFVVDIINKKYEYIDKDDEEICKEIIKKFNLWTQHMPENTKRYYLAKTSYWKVTDFGKQFVVKAYKFEQKAREKENE